MLIHLSVVLLNPKSEPFPPFQFINCSVGVPSIEVSAFNHMNKLLNSTREKKSREKVTLYLSSIASIIFINLIDGFKSDHNTPTPEPPPQAILASTGVFTSSVISLL